MGIIEEIMKNKEEMIAKIISLVEGKETSARMNLDGLKFKVGETDVKIEGDVVFTVVPAKGKKK